MSSSSGASDRGPCSEPFAAHALGFALQGYHVFPVAPIGHGGKRKDGKEPYPGTHGFKDASSDPEQITAWAEQYADANIGLACAASGLVVLDVDLDLDVEEDTRRWERFKADHDLPVTFAQSTSGGGLHLVYLAEPGVRYTSSLNDAEGKIADIKFNGYILLHPSIAKSGRRDQPGPYELLDDCDPVPAPELLARRSASPTTQHGKPTSLQKLARDAREHKRRETNPRLLNLLKETRNTIQSRDEWLRLGMELHAGYEGTRWEHDAYIAWMDFSDRWDFPKGTKLADFRENADQVWANAISCRDGGVMPATAQMILQGLPKLPHSGLRPATPECPETQSEEPRIALTGLAGRIAELVREASDRDLEVFPEAAGLMAMSSLAAPSFVIQGPQGLTTLCLFGLMLGGTGSGKEAIRKATDMALNAASRRDEFLDGIASDRALHRALSEGGAPVGPGSSRGARTIAIDEGGLHLDAIRKGNNGHQQMLLALMMRLWGTGLGRLAPHKYADNRNEIPGVDNPRLTMMWTSTPEALEKASSQEDSESGQLNRFLVFREEGFPELRSGAVNRDVLIHPPDDVVQACRHFPGRSAGAAVTAALAGGSSDTIIEMSNAAKSASESFRVGEVERMRRAGGIEGESWARATEYSLRVAGLLALSDGAMVNAVEGLENVKCEVHHVALAINIVRRAITGTSEFARRAGRTEIENLKDKVLATIAAHADVDGYARARDVKKSVLRGKNRPMRSDILVSMLDDGEIISEMRSTSGRDAEYLAVAREVTEGS